MKLTIKKIIKAFVPYGFIVLKRMLSRKKLLHGKGKKLLKNNVSENHLYSMGCEKLNENILKISHEEYKTPFYIRNETSDVYVYKEVIEKKEYGFSTESSPRVIIDAGANIGLSSIYFANSYPEAKIIAIEPEESNFRLLEKNIAEYKNITAIQAALWNTVGEIELYDTGLGSWGFMTGTSSDGILTPYQQKRHLVDSVTVDKIMEDYGIDQIDILKMDIEGSEKEVFENCSKWINKTNSIIVELHERMKKGCNKSFYKQIKWFDSICQNGEDIYVTKNNYIKMLG